MYSTLLGLGRSKLLSLSTLSGRRGVGAVETEHQSFFPASSMISYRLLYDILMLKKKKGDVFMMLKLRCFFLVY